MGQAFKKILSYLKRQESGLRTIKPELSLLPEERAPPLNG